MAEVVTLEVADVVLARAQERARRTGQPVGDILRGWLEQGAADDDILTMLAAQDHFIATPLGNDAAAQVLLDALAREEDSERDTTETA